VICAVFLCQADYVVYAVVGKCHKYSLVVP